MKKIPILLSILTASLGNIAFLTSTSSAMYQEKDTTWWTVEELLDFSYHPKIKYLMGVTEYKAEVFFQK